MIRTNPATSEEIRRALDDATRILEGLLSSDERQEGDRAAFVLASCLQILHATAPPDGRSAIEERLRELLAAMYAAPPTEAVIAGRADIVLNRRQPR